MKLIKFPLSNITGKEISLPNNIKLIDDTENVTSSLPYQDWEIDEIIENLSEDEQDLLIEKISVLVESWELTLDAELEALLQRRYKESKTNLNYVDWLYDLAQEEIYRGYAIKKLNEQKNKASLVGSNNSVNDKPISFPASNNQTATTTAATPAATPTTSNTAINFDNSLYSDAATNQSNINNNCLLDKEQQINQIIDGLSEDEQDALIEKIVILVDGWESTTDEGLKLALKTQHQKHQPNVPYQDFLYELAQSQVYREYAIEQLKLAKQSNTFRFIEPLVQIEKVYCDKANSVDELTFDEPIFDNVSQGTNNIGVQLLEANNYTTINNEGLETSSNSDIFIREKPIFDDVSPSAKENAVNKRRNLDCYQWDVGDNQDYRERITSSKDCVGNHITRALVKGCNFFIKYISGQTRYLSSITHNRKNSLPLTKAKKALLMHIHQGKPTSIYHPVSLPP